MNWIKFNPENPPEEHTDWLTCESSTSKHFKGAQYLHHDSFYNGEWESGKNITHYAELPEFPPRTIN